MSESKFTYSTFTDTFPEEPEHWFDSENEAIDAGFAEFRDAGAIFVCEVISARWEEIAYACDYADNILEDLESEAENAFDVDLDGADWPFSQKELITDGRTAELNARIRRLVRSFLTEYGRFPMPLPIFSQPKRIEREKFYPADDERSRPSLPVPLTHFRFGAGDE